MVSWPGGQPALKDAAGEAVERLGVVDTGLAGFAGPVGAVGAGLDEVPLVFGRQVQSGEGGAEVSADKDERVRAGRLGIARRRGVTASADRDVASAVVDADQVGDHVDGLIGVVTVAGVVAVAFQGRDDLAHQAMGVTVHAAAGVLR